MSHMLCRFATFLVTTVLIAGTIAGTQAQTLARLTHAATPDLPHVTTPPRPQARPIHNAPLPESSRSRQAARALFVDSNLQRANQLSSEALRLNSQDAEALFVHMEIAAMNGDQAHVVQSAMRLCEIGLAAPADPRVRLAAARLRELAANTAAFRSVIPHLQSLLTISQEPWPDLHEALLKVAMDGAPTLDAYAVSRSSGILTDWRIVGPLGSHPLLDQQPVSAADDLSQDSYQNRRVENFQFPDGRILLPDYMSRHGVFYAATGFSSLTAGRFTIRTESSGAAEVYADGERILRAGRGRSTADVNLTAGPHHILVKFIGSSAPLRVWINPVLELAQPVLPRKMSLQEMTYLLAASDYAAGEFATAASQIAGVSASENSIALQFLQQQSLARSSTKLSDNPSILDTRGWGAGKGRALSTAAEAEEGKSLAQSIADHPSCRTLLAAVDYYRQSRDLAAAHSAQQKLEGCAPESLDYARSLSNDGDHAAAAGALQRLLAAAPLNRAARQMLVRELQLSGNDQEAQRAAAEWLRIAPNAENYHRLAAGTADASGEQTLPPASSSPKEFYLPYRRDAAAVAREAAAAPAGTQSIALLDDHVAMLRPDGSVSLYIHSTRRALTEEAAIRAAEAKLPRDAQMLTLRVIHANGSATAIANLAAAQMSAGDTLDEEYVLHYAGDGGIPEHPEAFQFVFGSFDEQVLHARFVVLMPADRGDRGVVIASGDYPAMTIRLRQGMVERMWQEDAEQETSGEGLAISGIGLGIVRLVEQENGWTVPSNAEHRRRIETIHPGPRPEDS